MTHNDGQGLSPGPTRSTRKWKHQWEALQPVAIKFHGGKAGIAIAMGNHWNHLIFHAGNQSGCLNCDEFKCIIYWMRRKHKKIEGQTDSQY